MSVGANDRIFVAGHRGLVGSALLRHLGAQGCRQLLTADRATLDLRSQSQVQEFLARHSVDIVLLAAARVGGIHANATRPAEFVYDNLMIEANLIHAAHVCGVPRLLFLGSSCIYPREAEQPMREEALLTGPLEPTNRAYAIAKIAGLELCASYRAQYGRDYRSLMPTNLYGPNDNFHPEHAHVIPALLRRFHEAARSGAQEVVVWGSGEPRREFMHVDDLAAAAWHVLTLDEAAWARTLPPGLNHLNVGTGTDCSIRELTARLTEVTGFRGRVRFDASRPDGAPRKLLDVSRLRASGWQPRISLEAGLRQTHEWLLAHEQGLRTT